MTAILITSQHYLSDEIVAEKVAAEDFVVQVSPEFFVDGVAYRVILDGHHSFAAAIVAGRESDLVEADASDDDRVAILTKGDIEEFLAACWMDGEYQVAGSGKAVW